MLLEALDQVAAAELLVRHVDRGVAVQAGARLLRDLLPLGVGLVVEHVGVAALLAEILRERVAGPHRLQARVLLEPATGRRPSAGRPPSACAARPRCRRSACAPGRPCAGTRRTAAGSSCPRSAGSSVSSVSSTTRKNGFRASCLRSKMLTSRAVTPAATSAATTSASSAPRPCRDRDRTLSSWTTSLAGRCGRGQVRMADRAVAADAGHGVGRRRRGRRRPSPRRCRRGSGGTTPRSRRGWPLMRIGSWKRPVVKASEWWKPLSALVAYLGMKPCGVWQSLHTATARWLDLIHASYCSCITWQLAQAAESWVRYEAPFA